MFEYLEKRYTSDTYYDYLEVTPVRIKAQLAHWTADSIGQFHQSKISANADISSVKLSVYETELKFCIA